MLSIDSGIPSASAVVAVALLVALTLGGGCGGNSSSEQPLETTMGARNTKTATVRVTGTSGTPFDGSYGSTSAGTSSAKGEIPQDYEVKYINLPGSSDSVTANVQKRSNDYSKLMVQIIVDGETKQEKSTTADFGVVKVSWNTRDR